jgi:hypothetical protein
MGVPYGVLSTSTCVENEIKMNDNREIFEVPGVYENPRRQTLTLALTVYVKCLRYMKLVEFDTKFTNE